MAASEIESIRQVAERLAQVNGDSEPELRVIYWFPSEEEIRLVEVDGSLPDRTGDEQVAPFYFPPDPEGSIPYRAAIALVGVDDPGHTPLPKGWGEWEQAQVIWGKS